MPKGSIESRLIRSLLARWGRATRAMTLGVRVVVLDEAGHLLLVRHGYAPGWHLPGGAVDPGETVFEAATRELAEESGLIVETSALRLHGLFFNPVFGSRDHVAAFQAERYAPGPEPALNREIAERGWFAPDALPEQTTGATRRRLAEIAGLEPIASHW